jgi:hypothetical protein
MAGDLRYVIDPFRRPRNQRSIPAADGEGSAVNRACSLPWGP